MKPNIKTIYVTLVLYPLSLVDPKDSNSGDCCGFAPAMPRIIQVIAKGGLKI